jgi:hypothetical protein
MFKPSTVSCALLLLAGLLTASLPTPPAHAQAPTADESRKQSTESSLIMIQTAMKVWPDGRQHVMLQALRQTRDPRLQPVYEKLFNMTQPQMKIHGILGLTEIDPDKKLDLNRLASLKNVPMETEIVGALMEAGTLSDEQAQAIYSWNDLDAGVRVLVAVQLLAHGLKPDLAIIQPLTEKTTNLPQQAMANYVLFLAGKEEGAKALDALITLQDPRRDMMIDLLLRTSIKYKTKSVGPWALKVAQAEAADTKEKRNLRLLVMALRVSLSFEVPGAGELITKLYESAAQDPAARTRLALLTLYTYAQTPAPFFELLTKASEPMIKQVGLTGLALKTDTNAQEALDALVDLAHPQLDEWVLFWAGQKPTHKLAVPTLLAMLNRANRIINKEALNPTFRSDEQLDFASASTQASVELGPDLAGPQIVKLLQDPTTSLNFRQAVFMGLIRVRGNEQAVQIAKILPPESDNRLRSLALVFQASHGIKLSPEDLHDLGIFVQGGGIPTPVLRLIAGLAYLNQTNQYNEIIKQVSQ